ncbi:ABC transporter permease [Patulibacter sp. NPDC049589]|uniref:ABC transporter permease n=1 Tax=Patulibacter sp. NPDC049589 TaxID=3154731 RepID=UPI00342CCEE6
MNVFLDTLVTGLPLATAVLGIYMIFRLREDFDLTIDASFAMGAAVVATLLLHGWSVPTAMLAAIAAAGAMGLLTTALHLTLGVPVILAGLVMSIGFFSVNLRIMGEPSLNVVDVPTLFSGFADLPAREADAWTALVLAAIVGVVFVALALFLRTEVGLALRATGVNERMARSNGVDDRRLLALSLVIANGLAGLSGALVVQTQGFADVSMGNGTLIAGVGAVLLGELLVRPSGSKVVRIVLAVLLGTIAYRLVLVLALQLGLPATDLQGVTALTLVVAVAARRWGVPLAGRTRAVVRRRVTVRPNRLSKEPV